MGKKNNNFVDFLNAVGNVEARKTKGKIATQGLRKNETNNRIVAKNRSYFRKRARGLDCSR